MCYERARHNKEPLKSVQGKEQFDYFVIAFLKHIYIGEDTEHSNLSISRWVRMLNIGDTQFPTFYSTLRLRKPQ